jgi:hypothetical protein
MISSETLQENQDLLIPKAFLRSNSGFDKLINQQYIRIDEVHEERFKAALTSKGVAFIRQYLCNPL